ncbi:hypothetical protein HZS_753 [Henneguya salminicola]|nr:hypothetical protein HZS_753 [Henneguya salminicola]
MIPIVDMVQSHKLNEISSLRILFYFSFYLLGVRCMYYAPWKLAESACNLCYVGFGGISEKDNQDWTQCQNISIRKHEVNIYLDGA